MLISGTRWISLEDAVKAMGGDLRIHGAQELVHVVQRIPSDHFRLHLLYGKGPEPQEEGVVTFTGLAVYLRISGHQHLYDILDTVAADALSALTSVSGGAGTRTVGPGGATRWGAQPFRSLVRVRYPSLSVTEVVKLMGKHVAPGEKAITKSSFDAVAVGRQLPSPSFFRCLQRVLQAAPSELLTPASLAAFHHKYATPTDTVSPETASPLAAPSTSPRPASLYAAPEEPPFVPMPMPEHFHPKPPAAPSEPTDHESPEDLQFDPDDMSSDAYWAEQSRLMDAAAAEAIGMPGMSFEAGFNTIMGSPSDAADQDLCGND